MLDKHVSLQLKHVLLDSQEQTVNFAIRTHFHVMERGLGSAQSLELNHRTISSKSQYPNLPKLHTLEMDSFHPSTRLMDKDTLSDVTVSETLTLAHNHVVQMEFALIKTEPVLVQRLLLEQI